MNLISELMAKKLNRQEGYGRTGKYLSKFQKNYLGKLEKRLRDSGLEEKLAFEIANTLVRLRKDSLARLIDEGYVTDDTKRLVEKIKTELNHYQETGFTQKQTRALVSRLFSWQRMQEFLDSGLNRHDATQIVIKHSNPEDWWKEAKSIRDELGNGDLSKRDAARIVMMHASPQQWWEKAKPIRNRLMAEGLSKCDATQVVINWSNPKEWWEKAKLMRDKLMTRGLSKYNATRVIMMQANPEEWRGRE